MSMLNALKGSACIDWRDKKVYLTPLDFNHEGMFEEWLKGKERAELAALEPLFSPATYARLATEWVRGAASGVYSWTSENGQRALHTHEGTRVFLRLLLLPKHGEVNDKTIQLLIDEKWSEISLILKDFFTRYQAAMEAAAKTSKPSSSPDTALNQGDLATTTLEDPESLDLPTLPDSGSPQTPTLTGTFLGSSLKSNVPEGNINVT